jgi:hypothetical protein
MERTILGVLTELTGTANVSMWQLGAFLGFIGGFFRTSISTKND